MFKASQIFSRKKGQFCKDGASSIFSVLSNKIVVINFVSVDIESLWKFTRVRC